MVWNVVTTVQNNPLGAKTKRKASKNPQAPWFIWNAIPLKKIIALTSINEQIINMIKYTGHIKVQPYLIFWLQYRSLCSVITQSLHFRSLIFILHFFHSVSWAVLKLRGQHRLSRYFRMYSEKKKCYSKNGIFKTKLILENTRKRDMLNVAHKLMPTVWKTSLLPPWDT